MKNSLLTLTLILSCLAIFAQNPTVVLSQNKCQLHKVSDLNTMLEENGGPILDDLVAQGKLMNWGVLEHSWGDEYNWNIFYVAENEAKFFEAWKEFVNRAIENDPEFMNKFGTICSEHKDNIYTQIMGSNLQQDDSE